MIEVVEQQGLYLWNGKLLRCRSKVVEGVKYQLFGHLKKLMGTFFQQTCEPDSVLTKIKILHESLQVQDF